KGSARAAFVCDATALRVAGVFTDCGVSQSKRAANIEYAAAGNAGGVAAYGACHNAECAGIEYSAAVRSIVAAHRTVGECERATVINSASRGLGAIAADHAVTDRQSHRRIVVNAASRI